MTLIRLRDDGVVHGEDGFEGVCEAEVGCLKFLEREYLSGVFDCLQEFQTKIFMFGSHRPATFQETS